MSLKKKLIVIALSSAIALYAVVGGLLSDRTNVLAKGDPYVQLKIFGEVVKHIINDYVDEPNLEKVRIGALKGLTDGLDPYSAYLTREQVGRFNSEFYKKNLTGAVFSKVSGFLYVVAVIKGSPAEIAGLHNGDFIEYVGQTATRDVSLYDVQEILATKNSSQEIEFTVLRKGKSEKIKVKQTQFSQPAIESRIEESDIGYIKITSLTPGKAAEVRANITNLIKKGAKKLILDLRGTANGEITEGVAVANLFVATGTIAKTIGAHEVTLKSFDAKPADQAYNGPLTILINRSTAGAAEVIAGAVLNAKRGEIIGEKTFGAGTEQELFKLQDGAGLLLTTVKYAPAVGKAFLDEPIKPSIEVKVAENIDIILDDVEEQIPNPEQKDKNNEIEETKDNKPLTIEQTEDLVLKKAIELFKSVPAAKKAA